MPPLETYSNITSNWEGKQDEQRGENEQGNHSTMALQSAGMHACGGKGNAEEKSICACLKLLWVYKDHLKLSWLVHRDELSS